MGTNINDNNQSSNLTLSDLNEDCILHILSYLNLNDLFAIGCTSTYLNSIVQLINRKLKCTLHNISAKYVSRFLEVVGNHIRRLTVTIGEDCDTDTVINFFLEVQNYCFNLKHITIKKWKFLNFDKFEVMISRLTSLRLEECRFYDKHIIAHRRLAINPWITSPISFNSLYPPLCTKTNFFGSEILPMITSLELYECDCIQPEMFVDFLRGNNQLTHISLFRLSVFKKQMYNANFFNEMSKHMKNVERFSIDVDTSSEIQFISHLPNLRSLQLMNYSVANEQVVDTLLRKLAVRDTIIELDLYHCNLARQTFRTISELKKLTSLKLCKNFWVTEQHFKMCLLMPNLKKFCCFDCIQLSDEGLISIIKMAPNMETLDCSWCFQVTNRFIYDVSKDAKRLKLDILAGGRTKMTESILEDTIIKTNNDWLNLTFKPDMPITCILQDSICSNCFNL